MKRKRRPKAGAFYIYRPMFIQEHKAFRRKISRAAVIVPPLHDFYFTRHRFSSLGAETVAVLLRKEGIREDLLNFPAMKPKGLCSVLPEALDHLKPHIIPGETGRLSFFSAFRRFGPDADQCAAMIEKAEPDICFLSVFAFCCADDAIALAGKIREVVPSAIIAAGGAGVSVHPAYFLEQTQIDFALCGEAEAGLIPFLREIALERPHLERVPNLAWMEAGSVRISPVHAYAANYDMEIPLVKTAESGVSATFSTSLTRGCPKMCRFCSSPLLFGRTVRTPRIERLDALLSSLPEEIKNGRKRPVINIEDDNFLYNDVFLRNALALFRKHLPGAVFLAENGIDHSLLTPELCGWLADNGMSKFNLSIVSTASALLKKHGRFFRLENYEKIIGLLSRRGIPSTTYFICGLKDDTIESTADNIIYLYNKNTVACISMFYPVPGLPGFTDKKAFNVLPSILSLGSAAYPWNNSLSTASMITAFRLVRYINLKKTANRTEAENRLLTVIETSGTLHTLFRKNAAARETVIEVPEQDKELVQLFFRKLK